MPKYMTYIPMPLVRLIQPDAIIAEWNEYGQPVSWKDEIIEIEADDFEEAQAKAKLIYDERFNKGKEYA